MQNEFPEWLYEAELTPVHWWRYKSSVGDRIYSGYFWKEEFQLTSPKEFYWFEDLRDKVLKDNTGLIHDDNKIVMEFSVPNSPNVFIGWFDGYWSIGYSRAGDSCIEPIKIN